MPTHVGVDWASGVWVAVEATDEEEPTVRTHPSMLNVWEEYSDADAILVDIPIGLPEEGNRGATRRRRIYSAHAGTLCSMFPAELLLSPRIMKRPRG